ncbi:MAG: transglutaminase family protein [Pseudomonadota bacterium]
MAIHVGIDHVTHYKYDRAVNLSPHLIRLHPAPHTRTPLHDYRLDIAPANHRIYWQEDPFGNQIARVVFDGPVKELKVGVHLVAEMTVINPFDFFVEKYAENFPFSYDALLRQELEPYFELGENGPLLQRWLTQVDRKPLRIVNFLVGLNQRLQRDIDYTVRLDPGIQSCEETLEKKLGSCRDTGWLLVMILRHLGLAARFVSGYLVQLTADQKSLDGPSGPEEDFTDLHAWAEVYVPGAGWIGLDPTSGLFAGEGHIPLACTPEAVSAAAITGFSDKCEVEFAYHNVVRRVLEDPRVTKPYTEAQWQEICALGRQVDAELQTLDVRLTMGGEPTFVSIDDIEGAEWNTEALGVEKRLRAAILLRRLKETFAPGGLLHFGQGKWYPGEPLPRWALGCYWRSDGEPLWRDDTLIADEQHSYDVTAAVAREFGKHLIAQLGVASDGLAPAYEDWLYYLWREANQPPNLDPVAIPWAPNFRDDLSLALARGLDQPVGYVLPLAWGGSSWQSAIWSFERGALYLSPGSSPMGLRLPTRHSHVVTALCLEPRHGRLYLFMPPLDNLDRYTRLLRAVEAVAAAMALPLLIEGDGPPKSPQLRELKVTPDPGVIEVNIHPSGSWDELQHTTVTLYEAARLSRLGTEKFMVDGRHTGTGGGNHVTLGGPTVAESPFLRRPDVLASLLTFWQHHPSLSYLFSGLFIGPTSQAPRIDERGSWLLGELETSLKEVEGATQPWIIDRALRGFLADLTGNTHRAEFCIDKLWSADGPAGRQGLVEFRGFEMPPHARMSLAQMALLRVLVAHFWQKPYRQPLVRWGTALHDRFLLPHFVWNDFVAVIDELNAAGYPIKAEWYAPFHEFRFPVCGRARYDGVELELRTALEPWLVLGEEATAQRQARVVDSAVERLQVSCRGFDPERYRLSCNGRAVPLQAAGEPGHYVAAVRFKAWDSPFGLHPTVAIHAPLRFDLFDRGLGRSVGGCVYYVSHPGGRAYDTFPVNAYEAEARRIARFQAWGHTPGGSHGEGCEPVLEPNPDFPCTLDLRRVRL